MPLYSQLSLELTGQGNGLLGLFRVPTEFAIYPWNDKWLMLDSIWMKNHDDGTIKLWIMDIRENRPQKGKNLYSLVSFCDKSITFYRIQPIIKSTTIFSKIVCVSPQWQTCWQYTLQIQWFLIQYCPQTKFLKTQNLIFQSILWSTMNMFRSS